MAKSMSAIAYDGSLIAQCPQLNVDIYYTSPGAAPKKQIMIQTTGARTIYPRLGNLMRFGIDLVYLHEVQLVPYTGSPNAGMLENKHMPAFLQK
jgi:hypothetical protein